MKSDVLINFYEKHERYISPIVLLAGFAWDNLTLQRIDLWIDNLIIIIYLSITCLTILFLNAYFAARLRGRFFDECAGIAPFFMQFSFGGLFSAFLIFYSRSSAFGASWPFIFILVFLFIGNELFRKRYQRLAFQVSIFFVAIYAYLIFAVPILLDKLGWGVFLVSGFSSLVAISLFTLLLYFIGPEFLKQSRRWLAFGIGAIFIAFNILYFTNIIPPVPLSLKEGIISHSVARSGSNWVVKFELPPWHLFYKDYNSVYHWQSGERVYCYAAVFAPTKITTDIYHRWSFSDEKTKKWVEKSKIKYEITGGRDGGYRGYSYKTAIQPGKWRVDVINERGQVLGRMAFEVVQADSPPELTTVVY